MPSLSDFLRREIRRKYLPIVQLAREAGIPQQVLDRFVRGSRDNLRSDTLERLLKVLDLRIIRSSRLRDAKTSLRLLIENSLRRSNEGGIQYHQLIELKRLLDRLST